MTPYRTFEHDTYNERSAALLRSVGIVVVLLSVGGLALALRNWVGLLFSVAGLAACAGWVALVGRSRRRARGTVSLRLEPDALRLADGATTIELPWSDVSDVAVDEDRLDVRITRRDGDPLRIEPMFRGASVYDLADAICAAWRASTSATDRSGR
ncbi:hypothetical protein [Sandaracinus amylolyticus]|uniref:PH domain-containing protein n=1 Tax=Sandaracinus amylolyticus TaxID=927083 RepID=A0A0F6YK47_9BACT|nr:hypothetical protein [Sandaracinus amylolyticus]AKF06863.1 hypothetical protein DB32_004012 [Sandaracinus amylolyticus]